MELLEALVGPALVAAVFLAGAVCGAAAMAAMLDEREETEP